MNGWQAPDEETTAFLREFEQGDETPDEQAGSQFADSFVVADPQRALVVARELFVQSLPLRRKLFAEAGVGAATLVEASQLDLDPLHQLVSTTWRAPRTDGPDVILESTFLIRRGDPPQILVYLNHRDIAAVLAE